jgi:hypothetical protein
MWNRRKLPPGLWPVKRFEKSESGGNPFFKKEFFPKPPSLGKLLRLLDLAGEKLRLKQVAE